MLYLKDAWVSKESSGWIGTILIYSMGHLDEFVEVEMVKSIYTNSSGARETEGSALLRFDPTFPPVILANSQQIIRMVTMEGKRCDVILATTEERKLMPALLVFE